MRSEFSSSAINFSDAPKSTVAIVWCLVSLFAMSERKKGAATYAGLKRMLGSKSTSSISRAVAQGEALGFFYTFTEKQAKVVVLTRETINRIKRSVNV